MHSEFFSQSEFEQAIYKCLEFKLEVKLAAATDSGYGILCQKFSADNERESDLFRAATLLAAWLEKDSSGGECALTTFNAFVRRAKPSVLKLDLSDARRDSHKERTDFHIAEAENKPVADRIRELRESIVADERLLQTLEREERDLRQREAFAGQPVSHTARNLGAKAVRR
jgi:hypothetical protein